MNEVSIAIPFHLKGAVSNRAYEIAFKYYSRLPYTVHLCGSEEELSENFCKEFINDTTHYREVSQNEVVFTAGGHPELLSKFNNSLHTLPDTEWKCLIGADDIVDADFFSRLENIKVEGVCLAGILVHSLYYIVDINTSRFKRLSTHSVQGQKLSHGVSAINRSAMKINSGNPFFEAGAEIGLELEIHRINGAVIPINGFVLNIKGENTLHTFDNCCHYSESFDCLDHEKTFIENVLK